MSAHLGVEAHPDMLRFSDRAEQISKENIHPAGHTRLSQPLAATRDWSQELNERDADRVWALVRATLNRWATWDRKVPSQGCRRALRP